MKRKFIFVSVLGLVAVVFLFTWTQALPDSSQYKVDFPRQASPMPMISKVDFMPDLEAVVVKDNALIYKLRKEEFSKGQLRGLAHSFGVSKECQIQPDGTADWYEGPGNFLTAVKPGTFIFSKNADIDNLSKPFPEDNVLINKAERFLTDAGLLPKGFRADNVADSFFTELGSGDSYVEQRTVSFMRYVSGTPVYGNSRLTVSFDRSLNITGVDSVYSAIKEVICSPRLRSSDSVLENALAKEDCFCAFNIETDSLTVALKVTKVELVLWEDSNTSFLCPVYRYTGDVFTDQGKRLGDFVIFAQSY